MTWRYIKSVIVYFLVLLSSFRLHHNQLWHVTCHGNLPLLLSFAWPLLQPATKTVASVDGLCLPSVPRNNNLLIAQPNKYRIREHTHTHKCSSSSSASATGTVGGGPNVLVCLGWFATCTERVWSFSSCPLLSFSTILTIWAAIPNDIDIHQHSLACRA